MMRGMYAGVSGLKTHQTRMDVIGNNIANVNTVAFKSSSVTFQDMLYQNLSGASGANAITGVGGVNAKQVGLGVTLGATNINITGAGAAETTGRGFDIRLTDSNSTNFFIVNNGSENVFTRSGSFYVDGAGNLAMTSTGYTVMGWQVDPVTGEVVKDTVSALRIMKPENMTSPPEATTDATMSGVIDKNDPDVSSDTGLVKNLNFYDKLGYSYTARFAIKKVDDKGNFTVELDSILDSNGNAIIDADKMPNADLEKLFGKEKPRRLDYKAQDKFTPGNGKLMYDNNGQPVELQWNQATMTFENQANKLKFSLKDVFGVSEDMIERLKFQPPKADLKWNAQTKTLEVTDRRVSSDLKFSAEDGKFISVGGAGPSDVLKLTDPVLFPNNNFENITIDFSKTQNTNNGGKSTVSMDTGNVNDKSLGKGKKLGDLIGLSVDNNGKIFGSYDNGNTELLGQIAVAQFANASGLEKLGDNCYGTTLNSGDFDGIGLEVSADGSKMTSGELEMSNVDLSQEFTNMIVTQRGFQANSRIITTSDTMLEELVNLKR